MPKKSQINEYSDKYNKWIQIDDFLHQKVDDAVKFILNARSMRQSQSQTIPN